MTTTTAGLIELICKINMITRELEYITDIIRSKHQNLVEQEGLLDDANCMLKKASFMIYISIDKARINSIADELDKLTNAKKNGA